MNDRGSRALLLLVVGCVLLAAGIALGVSLGGAMAPIRAAEPSPSAPLAGTAELRELRELVEALASDVRRLRDLERPEASAPAESHGNGSTPDSAREPIAPPASGALEEILARLDRFEQTQRELLALDRAGIAPLELRIPPGMPVRDYLQALKDCGQGDDVKRAHLLWDMQRVREAYGAPDDVQEFDDHLEWIYKLREEGTQFDFHFVGGLVVEAH